MPIGQSNCCINTVNVRTCDGHSQCTDNSRLAPLFILLDVFYTKHAIRMLYTKFFFLISRFKSSLISLFSNEENYNNTGTRGNWIHLKQTKKNKK